MLGTPNTGKISTNGNKFRKGAPGWLRLEHLPCKKRLRDEGWFQPEEEAAPAGRPLRQSQALRSGAGQGVRGISLKKRGSEWRGGDYFHHKNSQAWE